MNAQSAVFSLLGIRPHTIRGMIDRLPYSPGTVYRAVEGLLKEGMLTKDRRNGRAVVLVSDGYEPQKLRQIHIQSLSHGIDPELLLRPSTLAVWKATNTPKSLEAIREYTGLSERWVRQIIKMLTKHHLLRYLKRRPAIVVREEGHDLNRLIEAFTAARGDTDTLHQTGTLPFREVLTTPEAIEKALYEQIQGSLAVKDTGFLVKGGDGKLTVLESVDREPTREELFLNKLNTPEGVEDACIQMIATRGLDYQRLLTLSRERDMVNEVGCYLDLVNTIRDMVDPAVVESFERNKTKRRRSFLSEERRYGKGGWEKGYEGKWNLDLYLDLGAIRHGMRSA